MCWTKDHNVLLLREILAVNPFQHKFGSSDGGLEWDSIAARLNAVEKPWF